MSPHKQGNVAAIRARQPQSLDAPPEARSARPVNDVSVGGPPNAAAHAVQLSRLAPARARQAAAQLQRAHGNRYVAQVARQASAAPLVVQPKLTVTPPNDQYEDEADRVAGKVMRQIDSGTVQRAFSAAPGDQYEDEQNRPAAQVMRKDVGAAGGGKAVSAGVESAIKGARGGGQPLPESTRAPMEQVFGANFGGVRVHTDAHANALNHELSARAFTTGRDIFFRQGEYAPASAEGQRLLAHELTHVVQQKDSRRPAETTIQRLLDEDFTHGGEPTEDEQRDCRTFAKRVSDFVDHAYNDLLAGRVKGWKGNKIATFLDLVNRGSSMAKTWAGNAIEERVYALMKSTDMKLPWTPQFTEGMGGASFPDIVINLAEDREGLVDITSDRGHILGKAGAWTTSKRYVYIAEAWFNSIREVDVPIIRKGIEEGGLDAEQIKAMKKAAAQERLRIVEARNEALADARKEFKKYGTFAALVTQKFKGNKKAATDWMYENGLGNVKGVPKRKGKRKPSLETRKVMRRKAEKARKLRKELAKHTLTSSAASEEAIELEDVSDEEGGEFDEEGGELEDIVEEEGSESGNL